MELHIVSLTYVRLALRKAPYPCMSVYAVTQSRNFYPRVNPSGQDRILYGDFIIRDISRC